MILTDAEIEVQRKIRIRGLVAAFIEHCRLTRPTVSRDTWLRAFNPGVNDSDLLAWIRSEAATFLESQVQLTASN